MPTQQNKLWIITEGLIGTENPCKGVAQALGIETQIMRIGLNEPWRTLCPYLPFENHKSFTSPLSPPWPELLLTNGRKSLAAARYIKKKSNGKTITVHLQDPRIKAPFLDLIAAPAHDQVAHKNAIETLATPNLITQELLESAQSDFPELGNMPAPKVAVLIGGKSKAYNFPQAYVEKLIKQLTGLNASLMVTCSRRTGKDNTTLIHNALLGANNFIWDGKNKNPYHAMLSWADYILVTADSTSMISESCTTGKPVFMIDLPGGSKRINRFHENLITYGALRKFNGTLEDCTYEPLHDAKNIAEEIKKRFKVFT